MGKTLVVAEKPSVGRDIAKTLKVKNKGEGYLFSDEYIVSWAIGHLVTLCDPEDYNENLKKWKKETLPIIPEEIKLKPIPSTKSQLNILKKLMNSKEVDNIVCATDSGREGELIFRYIYHLIKCKKPFRRLWISSMTETAIKEGFATLKDGTEYDNLYLSAKCRSEADWLVGINASRAFTLQYDTLLSIGRVQTPTLAILVERQKEINAFVPQEYWELKGFFENYSGMWFSENNPQGRFLKEEDAKEISGKVQCQPGYVKKVEDEEKKQPPPLLYDLTELQRDCNKKFGFTAKKTLTVAQDLYEKRKLITYPRTDSRYVSDDMIGKMASTLKKLQVEPYLKHTHYILGLPKLPISKRIVDNAKVSDHHAIIPTDTTPKIQALSEDERKVYDLVAKRFLAVFLPNYIYNITRITTSVLDELFISKGTTIMQLGYMELYKDDMQKNKEDTEMLPDLKQGDAVLLNKTEILAKKTKPPKLYNEASLLSAMENAGRFVEDEQLKEQLKESGIGTPATRAAIIERLIAVGYVSRNKKNLIPTEKGMKLIDIVPKELKSPETTGKWERGLGLIAKGQMDNAHFMGSINRFVTFLVREANRTAVAGFFPKEEKTYAKKGKSKALGTCPRCKTGMVMENSKGYYCTRWKEGCKFTLWKNALDAYHCSLQPAMVQKLLKDGKAEQISMQHPQTAEKYTATLVLKEDGQTLEVTNVTRLS